MCRIFIQQRWIDEVIVICLDVTEITGYLDNVFHAAADDAYLSVTGNGSTYDLLDAVYVAGEGSYDQTTSCFLHDFINALGNLLLGNGESYDCRVSRV